jgi:hypothetical protein
LLGTSGRCFWGVCRSASCKCLRPPAAKKIESQSRNSAEQSRRLPSAASIPGFSLPFAPNLISCMRLNSVSDAPSRAKSTTVKVSRVTNNKPSHRLRRSLRDSHGKWNDLPNVRTRLRTREFRIDRAVPHRSHPPEASVKVEARISVPQKTSSDSPCARDDVCHPRRALSASHRSVLRLFWIPAKEYSSTLDHFTQTESSDGCQLLVSRAGYHLTFQFFLLRHAGNRDGRFTFPSWTPHLASIIISAHCWVCSQRVEGSGSACRASGGSSTTLAGYGNYIGEQNAQTIGCH